MIIKQCISDEEAYITGDKLFFSEKSNTSGPPWSSMQVELYVISCSNSRGTKGGWIWKENRHNQNYNHPQTFVHDVTMTVAGIHTEAVLDTFFPLSYFAIYVLFEFGCIIFEWGNPIWLFTSPSIRNNRNLLHPVCHFRMCIKRVLFPFLRR